MSARVNNMEATKQTRQMSQISIDNYFAVVKPKLTAREQWVLEALEEIAPACTEDVADYLKVPPHVISGRMTGLKNKRKIRKAYRGENKRGTPVDYWTPTDMEREEVDAG